MGSPKDRSNTTVIGDMGPGIPVAEFAGDGAALVDDELASTIAELGGGSGGWVRCYKWSRSPSGTEEGWHRCYRAPVEGFDPDRVAERWGPGKYRFQITDHNNRVVKVISLSFAAPAAAGPSPAPYPVGSGAGAASSLSPDILALYQGQQKFLENMVLALLAKGSGGGAAVSMSDVLEALKLGKEMAGGGGGAQELFQSVRDAVQLARELGNGGGEPPDLLSSLGPSVIDLIGRFVGGRGEARPAAVPGAAPQPAPRPRIVPLPNARPRPAAPASNEAPAPAAAAPAPLSAAPAADTAIDVAAFARQYAPLLLTEAEADRDPDVWGTWIAERLPDMYARPLLSVCCMDSEARIELLARFSPNLRQHQEWIDEAAAAIVEFLEGDSTDAQDVAGDVADPAGARGAGNQSDDRSHPADDSPASGSPSGQVLRGSA